MIDEQLIEDMVLGYWEKDEADKPKASYPQPSEYVEEYYKTAGITPNPETCKTLVREEFYEWFSEVDYMGSVHYSKINDLKELADLVYVVYGYALSRGWDLDEALYRVFKNNLARMRWDDGLIHRNEDGKILKSPTAPKIDLSDLV